MKIAYKLTDSEMKTFRGFQWELGKWYKITEKGDLCSSSWFHFYSDPLVGMFLNPAHADIGNPRLFRAEVEGNFIDDNGTKCGYSRAKLIEELPVPQISPVQRIRFAILYAKEVYKEKEWNEWADNWLSGKDRTEKSAAGAAYTAKIIAESTAESAFYAAKSAESAFYAAKSAESAFYAAKSTENAFYTAKSTTSAAESAIKSKKINLIRIARKAMEE